MMKRNYCTLFDINYLSRGIAMYNSLKQWSNDFHLYIFAFDDKSLQILREECLEHTTVISLNEFEDEKLLAVKPSRNRAEYCWTCTSSTIIYCINKFHLDSCTYLDADLFFYSSPEPIFKELGTKSILLTEHKYSAQYARDNKNGKYCVQFISFKNDSAGMEALEWWRERCLEWCYDRHESGKFGDQGYLNDWSERFEGVHSLQHLGGGVAAWNVQQYEIFSENGDIKGKEFNTGNVFPIIFYHYHYLKFINNGTIELGRRKLSPNVFSCLYIPYIKELLKLQAYISDKYQGINSSGSAPYRLKWKTPILYILRKLRGVYHIYKVKELLE